MTVFEWKIEMLGTEQIFDFYVALSIKKADLDAVTFGNCFVFRAPFSGETIININDCMLFAVEWSLLGVWQLLAQVSVPFVSHSP